ncbi:MAG: PstS family phosphate ABC transporter substrate-binding protein [Fimbriimonadaceae bacterium]|nr:PstS family phosphate ABC transporter substrate-binding protein [Fimbriimonadaceae bacterium]
MKTSFLALTAILAAMTILVGCGGGSRATEAGGSDSNLEGRIRIDGSSTVHPIASALTTRFSALNRSVRVSVGESGTGAGFEKFAAGEIQIATASKPISEEQAKAAADAGIEFIELPIAIDGLSIVVNAENTWATSITMDQLKKIWDKDSKISRWNEIDPSWPDEPLVLFGPNSDHGSYEYFNEVVNGDKKNSRQDYQATADYNQLIQGVNSSKGALGYVGFAYVEQNQGAIKVLGLDAGKGVVVPSNETIKDGTYFPMSRPLFIYVNKAAASEPAVKAFVEYALTDGKDAVTQANYVPLADEQYARILKRFQDGVTGTVFNQPGKTLSQILDEE